ncbi:MAG TPA: alpha/beta hydrolase [Usitatibacteraceae bacterium]|nr:alpha/beta hydrolase [Usitatibacteraceae bacterium]
MAQQDALFPGFRAVDLDAAGVAVHAVVGGNGPPLLLLHGYPQTHALWHKVAPRLAERYTVVAPDLRGYGDSGKPATDARHAPYSKREMAKDPVAAMRALGFGRFFLAGHDRGARVAHRLAMDHGDAVEKVAVLDISPTLAMYEQTDMAFARAYWHWFFLIQPAPLPETMIGADPVFYLERKMGSGAAGVAPFAPEAWKEYVRCFTPETIHASCEDYRAAATIDLEHDRADRDAGRRIACPLLALWGANGVVERCFKPLEDWSRVAADVRGHALPAGHYLPEEVPDLVAAEFETFFGA